MAYIKSKKKVTVYEVITDRIISLLEKGVIPWQKPSHKILDHNLTRKDKPYHGINVLLTGYAGFNSPFWVTFKEAKKLGGFVNSGEKGTPIFFWGHGEKDKMINGQPVLDSKGNPEKETYFFPRYYTVHNVEQCTLPEGKVPEVPVREEMTDADSVITEFKDCPEINYGNFDVPKYSDDDDYIKMPVRENYKSEEDFFAGLFKMLVHSTRHKKRMYRKEKSETYKADAGFEELVGEIGAAFLCYECGIETVIPNQTAYIQKWLTALRENKTMVVYAAGQARKAVEYILRDNKTVKQYIEVTVETDSSKENLYDVL